MNLNHVAIIDDGGLMRIFTYESTRTFIDGVAFSRDLDIIPYIAQFGNKPTIDEMKRNQRTIYVQSLSELLAEKAFDEEDILRN